MDITPVAPAGRQVIQAYRTGGFRIGGSEFEGSILVFPDRVVAWSVARPEEISVDSLGEVLGARDSVDILLVGCGPRGVLLSAPLRDALSKARIVVESMDTGAACRTYNVLLAEDRRVAAALIALP